MRQPQMSYQGQLEPVTRLINCHFGQLANLAIYVCICYEYEQLDCSYSKSLQLQLRALGNLKT